VSLSSKTQHISISYTQLQNPTHLYFLYQRPFSKQKEKTNLGPVRLFSKKKKKKTKF